MCGIFAINKTNLTSQDKHIVNSSLDFRGPDFQSSCTEYNGWTLYHSRLSIIGLGEENNQPLLTSKGALVYNGEIFNYKKLGRKYFNKIFRSDTKLLFQLIIENKLDLDELDGFFSFVFIDCNGKLKYAARDALGVKPLFSYSNKNLLGFSSEASVFNRLFNLGFNSKSLEEYASIRYPVFSGSYFNKVHSVNPGSCFVNGDHFDLKTFFLNQTCKPSIDELEDALSKGIKTRMVSDARIGLLLSKGVDSNILRNLSKINNLYSVGFTGDEDLDYVSKNINFKAKCLYCSNQDYTDTFSELIKLRGEPLSVPNEVLLFLVARKARKDGIKVLLSGEGADEIFGGYDRIFTWASKNIDRFCLNEFLKLYSYKPPNQNSHVYECFKNFFDKYKTYNTFEKVRIYFIKYHLPILFRRLDFSLMAAGVEGREPIANKHILKLALQYNSHELMSGGLGKIPLRKILAKYEGFNFAFEKKVGFPVDLKDVFGITTKITNYEVWFNKNLEQLGL